MRYSGSDIKRQLFVDLLKLFLIIPYMGADQVKSCPNCAVRIASVRYLNVVLG